MLFWTSRNKNMLQHFLNVIFHYSHHIYYVKRKALFIFPNIVAELLFLTFFFGLHNSVFICISWYLLFQSFVIKNCVVLLFGLFLTQSSTSMKVIDDSDLQMGNTHVRRVIYWHSDIYWYIDIFIDITVHRQQILLFSCTCHCCMCIFQPFRYCLPLKMHQRVKVGATGHWAGSWWHRIFKMEPAWQIRIYSDC